MFLFKPCFHPISQNPRVDASTYYQTPLDGLCSVFLDIYSRVPILPLNNSSDSPRSHMIGSVGTAQHIVCCGNFGEQAWHQNRQAHSSLPLVRRFLQDVWSHTPCDHYSLQRMGTCLFWKSRRKRREVTLVGTHREESHTSQREPLPTISPPCNFKCLRVTSVSLKN